MEGSVVLNQGTTQAVPQKPSSKMFIKVGLGSPCF
jgi:hypothetical protein